MASNNSSLYLPIMWIRELGMTHPLHTASAGANLLLFSWFLSWLGGGGGGQDSFICTLARANGRLRSAQALCFSLSLSLCYSHRASPSCLSIRVVGFFTWKVRALRARFPIKQKTKYETASLLKPKLTPRNCNSIISNVFHWSSNHRVLPA